MRVSETRRPLDRLKSHQMHQPSLSNDYSRGAREAPSNKRRKSNIS